MPKRSRYETSDESSSKLVKLDNYQLGLNFYNGDNGCNVDYHKAFTYLSMDGSSDANFFIGKMYENDYRYLEKHDSDDDKDYSKIKLFDGNTHKNHYYKKAVDYYSKCVTLNHVKGMWNLYKLTSEQNIRTIDQLKYLLKLGKLGFNEAYEEIAFGFYGRALYSDSRDDLCKESANKWLLDISESDLFAEMMKNMKLGADLGNITCAKRYGFLLMLDHTTRETPHKKFAMKEGPIDYAKNNWLGTYMEFSSHRGLVIKDDEKVIDEALGYLLDGYSSYIKYIFANKKYAVRYLTDPTWCKKLLDTSAKYDELVGNMFSSSMDYLHDSIVFRFLGSDATKAVKELSNYADKDLDEKAFELQDTILNGINKKTNAMHNYKDF